MIPNDEAALLVRRRLPDFHPPTERTSAALSRVDWPGVYGTTEVVPFPNRVRLGIFSQPAKL